MSKSPGHQQDPDHKVRETHLHSRATAAIDGQAIAESSDVIRVDEDGAPPRYYFPRDAVHVGQLTRSDTTTTCPFKGLATYYSFKQGDREFKDAIWSYEEPYDEHAALKGRMAFYDDRYPAISVAA
jgi:uncharacterized protein (DUF427 family)